MRRPRARRWIVWILLALALLWWGAFGPGRGPTGGSLATEARAVPPAPGAPARTAGFPGAAPGTPSPAFLHDAFHGAVARSREAAQVGRLGEAMAALDLGTQDLPESLRGELVLERARRRADLAVWLRDLETEVRAGRVLTAARRVIRACEPLHPEVAAALRGWAEALGWPEPTPRPLAAPPTAREWPVLPAGRPVRVAEDDALVLARVVRDDGARVQVRSGAAAVRFPLVARHRIEPVDADAGESAAQALAAWAAQDAPLAALWLARVRALRVAIDPRLEELGAALRR